MADIVVVADLNITGDFAVIDTGDNTRCGITLKLTDGTWSAATLTIRRTNDPTADPETGTPNSADWHSVVPSLIVDNEEHIEIDCTDFRYLGLETTTPEGTHGLATAYAHVLRPPSLVDLSEDFLIEVQKGNVRGHSIIHKFGSLNVGTVLTPVCVSGFYRTPTVDTALELVSDDATDNSAGIGAREVTIVGLDDTWNEVTQTVVPNGVTPVALSTNLIRLYRMFVSSSGTYPGVTTGSHAGNLTIQESGGGIVWSAIPNVPLPLGQSKIGFYTISIGKTGYVLSIHVIVDSNKSVDAYMLQRPNADDVTSPYAGALRVLKEFIGTKGDVNLVIRSPDDPLVGPADIGFLAQVASGSGAISVDFEILLVDD